MNEAQRFMRYVLPGMVSLLLFTVFSILASGKPCEDIIKFFNDKGTATVLGSILTVFLSSGALGYLFSTLYFLLSQKCIGLDHRPAIRILIDDGYNIQILCSNCMNKYRFDNSNLTIQDALAIINAWWWYLRGIDKSVKSIDDYLLRLSDAFHCLGATVVGTIIGFIIWLFSAKFNIYYFSFWAIIIVLLSANLYFLRLYLQRYANTVFLDAVQRHPDKFIRFKLYPYVTE